MYKAKQAYIKKAQHQKMGKGNIIPVKIEEKRGRGPAYKGEIESDWEVQEVESEDASQTLGEQDSDCTSGVRQYVSEEESEGNESEDESISASQSVGGANSVGDEVSMGTHAVCPNANNNTQVVGPNANNNGGTAPSETGRRSEKVTGKEKKDSLNLVEIDMAKDLPQAVMLKLTSGEIIEQPIHYENLTRFCKLCREAEATTGALNTDLDQVAAAAETTTTQAAHKGKRGQTEGVQNANQLAQAGAGATATGQAAQLMKRGKAEWVQVHARSSKIQPDSRNIIPNAGPVLGNKFSALAEALETEVERLQIQETEPAQSQVNHYGKRNQGQNQHKANQTRGQIRGAVQQANKPAGDVLKITTQQNPKFQSGISMAAQTRITSQIVRNAAPASTVHRRQEITQASSSSIPPPSPLAKKEDARKKNEKMQAGWAGNNDQMAVLSGKNED
ncbi:hypothetical protein Acr_17g0011370 [Actinidia rufa]|uniref:Uncharacterized protein n=1 Tax=Actinidia rufa TaxID=165716 RepID=A0A7J0G446_9ERIC|nr:hypothetical protein Acr_17g0011370 [Actinidia rufa]